MKWKRAGKYHLDSACLRYRICKNELGNGPIYALYRVGQQPPPIAIGDLDLCKRAAEAHGRGE